MNDSLLPLVTEINEKGFAVLRHALTKDEVENLRAELDQMMQRRFSHSSENLLRTSALVASYSDDRRLRAPAESLLGPTTNAFSAFFLDKNMQENWQMPWHQNLRLPVESTSPEPAPGLLIEHGVPHLIPSAEFLDRILIVRITLDQQKVENGALELIPASHKRGILDQATIDSVGGTGQVACPELNAGDVFFFKALLVHRSQPSTMNQRRRVLQLEYSAQPPPEGFRWYGL